jgi:hypothetical protein
VLLCATSGSGRLCRSCLVPAAPTLGFGGGRSGRVSLRGMTSRADRLGGRAVTKGSRRVVKPTVPAQPPCGGPPFRNGRCSRRRRQGAPRLASAALRESPEIRQKQGASRHPRKLARRGGVLPAPAPPRCECPSSGPARNCSGRPAVATDDDVRAVAFAAGSEREPVGRGRARNSFFAGSGDARRPSMGDGRVRVARTVTDRRGRHPRRFAS